VFFDWRRGQLALIVVVLLGALVAATMIAFSRHSKSAALMLLPYLLWVSFATALTASVWQRNPDLL
jgi:tryptophan-rich sensory protein